MNVNIWFVNERIMLCLERCLCNSSPPSATNCTNQPINVYYTIETLTLITR